MQSVPEAMAVMRRPKAVKPKAYAFKENTLYENIGHCMFVSGDFVTFLHATPCTASTANTMDMNGWEIYVQPKPYHANFFRVGEKSYIVTYRKKNRG